MKLKNLFFLLLLNGATTSLLSFPIDLSPEKENASLKTEQSIGTSEEDSSDLRATGTAAIAEKEERQAVLKLEDFQKAFEKDPTAARFVIFRDSSGSPFLKPLEQDVTSDQDPKSESENLEITDALKTAVATEYPGINIADLLGIAPMMQSNHCSSVSGEKLGILFSKIEAASYEKSAIHRQGFSVLRDGNDPSLINATSTVFDFNNPIVANFTKLRGGKGSSWRRAGQGLAVSFGGMVMDYFANRHEAASQGSRFLKQQQVAAPNLNLVHRAITPRNFFDEKIRKIVATTLNSDRNSVAAPWKFSLLDNIKISAERVIPSLIIKDGISSRTSIGAQWSQAAGEMFRNGWLKNSLLSSSRLLGLNKFVAHCDGDAWDEATTAEEEALKAKDIKVSFLDEKYADNLREAKEKAKIAKEKWKKAAEDKDHQIKNGYWLYPDSSWTQELNIARDKERFWDAMEYWFDANLATSNVEKARVTAEQNKDSNNWKEAARAATEAAKPWKECHAQYKKYWETAQLNKDIWGINKERAHAQWNKYDDLEKQWRREAEKIEAHAKEEQNKTNLKKQYESIRSKYEHAEKKIASYNAKVAAELEQEKRDQEKSEEEDALIKTATDYIASFRQEEECKKTGEVATDIQLYKTIVEKVGNEISKVQKEKLKGVSQEKIKKNYSELTKSIVASIKLELYKLKIVKAKLDLDFALKKAQADEKTTETNHVAILNTLQQKICSWNNAIHAKQEELEAIGKIIELPPSVLKDKAKWENENNIAMIELISMKAERAMLLNSVEDLKQLKEELTEILGKVKESTAQAKAEGVAKEIGIKIHMANIQMLANDANESFASAQVAFDKKVMETKAIRGDQGGIINSEVQLGKGEHSKFLEEWTKVDKGYEKILEEVKILEELLVPKEEYKEQIKRVGDEKSLIFFKRIMVRYNIKKTEDMFQLAQQEQEERINPPLEQDQKKPSDKISKPPSGPPNNEVSETFKKLAERAMILLNNEPIFYPKWSQALYHIVHPFAEKEFNVSILVFHSKEFYELKEAAKKLLESNNSDLKDVINKNRNFLEKIKILDSSYPFQVLQDIIETDLIGNIPNQEECTTFRASLNALREIIGMPMIKDEWSFLRGVNAFYAFCYGLEREYSDPMLIRALEEYKEFGRAVGRVVDEYNNNLGERPSDLIDDGILDAIKELDFKTQRHGSIFWTGFQQGNFDRAKELATEQGKMTINDTLGGRFLGAFSYFNKDHRLTDKEVDALWQWASVQFAHHASGANFAIMYGTLFDRHRVYYGVEYPILKQNPNTTLLFETTYVKGKARKNNPNLRIIRKEITKEEMDAIKEKIGTSIESVMPTGLFVFSMLIRLLLMQ